MIRSLARYKACHVTYQLKMSFMSFCLAYQLFKLIQNPAFWLVGQPDIHGGNFKLIGHVTSLTPLQGSTLYLLFSIFNILFIHKHNSRCYFTVLKLIRIFTKISEIGPWVNRINWCEGRWFCSTYVVVRLSDVSSSFLE